MKKVPRCPSAALGADYRGWNGGSSVWRECMCCCAQNATTLWTAMNSAVCKEMAVSPAGSRMFFSALGEPIDIRAVSLAPSNLTSPL